MKCAGGVKNPLAHILSIQINFINTITSMPVKHIETEIIENDPLLNCKLGRQKYAEVLTQIVEGFPEGFVLAIKPGTATLSQWEQIGQAMKIATDKGIEFKLSYVK